MGPGALAPPSSPRRGDRAVARFITLGALVIAVFVLSLGAFVAVGQLPQLLRCVSMLAAASVDGAAGCLPPLLSLCYPSSSDTNEGDIRPMHDVQTLVPLRPWPVPRLLGSQCVGPVCGRGQGTGRCYASAGLD